MTWEQAWQEGRTRWDAGDSPPALMDLVAQGEGRFDRAFVPGCGSGYDVFTLTRAARRVVGLDVAPTAARRFAELRDEMGVPSERATMVVDDFFTFEPEAPFDLIWDYTFLCAIEPERRKDWASRMDELSSDDAELWTLIFPVDPVPLNPGGPPYPMTPELVRSLLEPTFSAVSLEPVTRSHPGRDGKEWLGRWRKVR
ncbi:MAG TPA: methyltransferase domain-containing protein [Polyangiaceae bacterium]|nr:methyltransferase domain-containing protein [Polyangiaceae bacterium]